MNRPKKNFVELNKNLAKLHLTKRMPTAPNRKIVANSNRTLLNNSKKNSNSQKHQLNSYTKLSSKMANVSFEDDLDMAMTSAGYALYIAIKRQQLREIVRLLEAGAHYHIKNGLRGGGPLHQLITLCPGELSKRFRLKTAEVMLDYGVDPNLTDFFGKTALMIACSEGYLELVKLLSPKTDPLIQDCRLNTALIYAVLGQKVSCFIELLKGIQLPLVSKVITVRNSNGYNAVDLAKQLGNRELILHLTHYLAYAEQNTIKSIKKNKLDPRYIDNYWLYKQKYMKPDLRHDHWLDSWHSPYRLNNPLYWNTSRSMESLSTKDDFEVDYPLRLAHYDKLIEPKEIRKLGRENSLLKSIKNRDKAISSHEEVEKVLKGHNLSRLDRLNLRRKLEEEKLNRAMSMYNLSSRKYIDDPHSSMIHPLIVRDDESVSSSMIFDYDLQNNLKKMREQRLIAEGSKRKTNDRYLDQLMLSDNMFYGEPYGEQWERETLSWFKNKNAKQKDNKMPNQTISTHHHHNQPTNTVSNTNNADPQSNSSTLPRRMSRSNEDEMGKNFKLPPIPNQRKEDYETWLQMQQQEDSPKNK